MLCTMTSSFHSRFALRWAPRVSRFAFCLLIASLLLAAAPATQPKPTVAVLPFLYTSPAEKKLAERMRFAVSQKLSRDGNVSRTDTIEVDQFLSALQIPMSTDMPSDDDLQKILATLHTTQTILGSVSNRTLTLTLYIGSTKTKSASVAIPPDTDSPRLAVEKILTDLTATEFTHIRDVECDHSDPVIEKLFAQRPNLVPDPSFEDASTDPQHVATAWSALLGADEYPPGLLHANAIDSLPDDQVAIVPKFVALHDDATGNCLLLRMSKNIAENNGLACTSTWIAIDANKKYRFTALYHSTGPALHLFLDGFAEHADQFGDKSNPEATRRQAYRFQVLPRGKTEKWTLIEADFTPSSTPNKLKPNDTLTVQWLRIKLYIYLHPGDVYFDDITLKKIAPD